MLDIKTILHPTDFSESSIQALEVARALARDHHANLVVATIPFPPPPDLPAYLPPTPLLELEERAKEALKNYIKTVTDVPIEMRTHVGDPGRTIVAIAEDCHADVIVMGTRGLSGVARLLLGSVTQYVMRHAECAVLMVKPGLKSGHQSQVAHESDTVTHVPAPIT